jgi:UDP-N-acetylglucosamine acyltransferase
MRQQTQDLKYVGEPTYLEIGDRNTFREFSTIHRATAVGEKTKIGSGGNFLAYSHVAHECIVGENVIFSNNGTLGGHVTVGDRAYVGGLAAVHQFCRIGTLAIVGGCAKVVQDVPPYMIVDGNPAAVRGINQVGLERSGATPETIKVIREAYRILFRLGINTVEALTKLESEYGQIPEIQTLISFIQGSERGILRRNRRS